MVRSSNCLFCCAARELLLHVLVVTVTVFVLLSCQLKAALSFTSDF